MSADDDRDQGPRVRVLTVCTGNICRSPYAAALLRSGLDWARPGAFEVTSAGTHALVGRPMDPAAARLLEERRVPSGGFRARLLSHRVVEPQDVVLVMSGQHRALVVDESPSAHRRVLGLRDLAAELVAVGGRAQWEELLGGVGATDVRSRWRALPDLLAAQRGRAASVTDVADPYGRGDRAFAAMADVLDDACRTVVLWEAQFDR